MSLRRKRSSARRSSQNREDTSESQPNTNPAAVNMEEEIGRSIEKTTVALASLLHTVESTAQQVCRLAEEHQSSIAFFASWHKCLKEQEDSTHKEKEAETEKVDSRRQSLESVQY